jgi:TldD protein
VILERLDCTTLLAALLKNGGLFGDLFFEHSRSTSVICEDNKVEKVISGSDTGLGLRVIFDYKTSYGYLSTFVDEQPGAHWPIKRAPKEIPLEEKVGIVNRANDFARAFDKRIVQVRVIYNDQCRHTATANSGGHVTEDEKTSVLFAVQVVAVADGEVQTGSEHIGGTVGFELFENTSPEDVASKASSRAVMMLTAKKAPGGPMPVVLSSEAGGTMIHEAIGHGLEADLAQQGLSVYSGKKGERVASSLITVIDDATLPFKRGSFSFDDEGTPSQKSVLVDGGVLQNFLYDRLTALKDGVKSTGNGRRQSYRHRPIPRMTNTYIAPGPSLPEDILRATPTGLFVKKMGGGQVDTITGDFVFEVSEGYRIEGGTVGEPLRGATLTGNGPRILKEIDMVGNDLDFSIGTCGKDGQGAPVSSAQPTLRIPEITVGGIVS